MSLSLNEAERELVSLCRRFAQSEIARTELDLGVRRARWAAPPLDNRRGREAGFERVIELMADWAYRIDGWVEHIPLDASEEAGLRALRNGTKVRCSSICDPSDRCPAVDVVDRSV